MLAYLEHFGAMPRGLPNPESPQQIGERLRITRAALGHTQGTMCRLMGSSSPGQAWENYEAGRRRISIDHALALCKHDLTLPWIYQGNIQSLGDEMRQKILVQMRLEAGDQKRRASQ